MADTTMDKRTKKRLESDPNRFITRVIEAFVEKSPSNRLALFEDAPIFEAPLVAFADGDDPIFETFKKVVHEEHPTPREILIREKSSLSPFPDVSVISFVLPINPGTLESNARETEGPSLRWNQTRWKGQDFITELTKHIVSVVESSGASAVAPDLLPSFKILRPPDGNLVSNWSHRHMAYAAGLGTFSLNDGFITAKGMAMRCGSVVTSLKLEPSARLYEHHRANCLFFATGKCGACIRRCPGGALSETGHDKTKCLQILFETQKPWIEGVHGPGYIGMYAGCGLCQTGVPCEHRIPTTRGGRKKVG